MIHILGNNEEDNPQALQAKNAVANILDEKLHTSQYDFPDGRLTQKGDSIKLQKNWHTVTLIYQQKATATKKEPERYIVEVNNYEQMKLILQHIGLIDMTPGALPQEDVTVLGHDEIEVKIIDIDVEEVRKKLEALGAIKVFEGEVHASYYDFSDRSITQQKNVLRLRKKWESIVELVYKQKVLSEGVKKNKEYEVEVNDYEIMKSILQHLWLEQYKTMPPKQRESYSIEDVHFELDTITDCPTYLEIEAWTDTQIKECVEKLWYHMEDTNTWSQTQVVTHYKNTKN